MLSVGEDENVVAWLGVPMVVCDVKRLFKGCG